MRRAVAYSFAVEFATVLSVIGCFKIAVDTWGAEGFGQWALARRIVSFFVPLVTCGLEIAIPRYLVYQRRERSSLTEGDYMVGALIFIAGALTLTAVVLLSTSAHAARTLFGMERDSHLIAPLVTVMIGCGLFIPAYAYFRGTLQIMRANLIYLLMFGVVPVVAVTVFSNSPARALTALGVISTTFSLAYLLWIFGGFRLRSRQPWHAARILVRFGATRMYAAFGLMALATLPAVLVAHSGGITQAGYVVFALTLIGLAGSAAAPVGVTLLPHVSELAAQGRVASLRVPLQRLHRLLLGGGIVGYGIVWFAAPLIVDAFFGVVVPEAVLLLRLAAVGAGPYAYFMCVRNVIDASIERGVNARIVAVALIMFFCTLAIGFTATAPNAAALVVVAAYVAACLMLAILALLAVRGIMARASLTPACGRSVP